MDVLCGSEMGVNGSVEVFCVFGCYEYKVKSFIINSVFEWYSITWVESLAFNKVDFRKLSVT